MSKNEYYIFYSTPDSPKIFVGGICKNTLYNICGTIFLSKQSINLTNIEFNVNNLSFSFSLRDHNQGSFSFNRKEEIFTLEDNGIWAAGIKTITRWIAYDLNNKIIAKCRVQKCSQNDYINFFSN